MTIITATEARADLFRLMDKVAEEHTPITITGRRVNAVLVSEEDWSGIQETLFLMSIPGMRESLVEGMATPIADCSKEEDLDW